MVQTSSTSSAPKKVLHILNDGPDAQAERIIAAQAKDHRVEVVDLTAAKVSYDQLVDRIFACDRVISW